MLVLLVTPQQIGGIIQFLTQHELSEDPRDLIANTLLLWTGHLSVSASLFGAAYLLLHGLVKIVLVWAVLTNHLWAYPWMIAFRLIFIAYQSYELFVHFSWWLVALTAFDIFIVCLTWREYGIHRGRRHGRTTPQDRTAITDPSGAPSSRDRKKDAHTDW